MTPRILPGSLVRYDDRDCAVLSTLRLGDRLLVNIRCGDVRIPNIPAESLTAVNPPPAIGKVSMRGMTL